MTRLLDADSVLLKPMMPPHAFPERLMGVSPGTLHFGANTLVEIAWAAILPERLSSISSLSPSCRYRVGEPETSVAIMRR